MQDILSAVVPLFLVVATGCACTRFGLFGRTDIAILSRFVVKVALPLLVFVNVAGRTASEIFNPTYRELPPAEAIVTAGGVEVSEVIPRTMESRLTPGLFFAGEILDIQADTGGYNLQAAFSTGWLAGRAAAARITEGAEA